MLLCSFLCPGAGNKTRGYYNVALADYIIGLPRSRVKLFGLASMMEARVRSIIRKYDFLKFSSTTALRVCYVNASVLFFVCHGDCEIRVAP